MSATTKCPNCDAEFKMPKNAVPERQKLGWCTGCYGQMHTNLLKTTHDGREYWGRKMRVVRRDGSRSYSSRLTEGFEMLKNDDTRWDTHSDDNDE